MQISIERHACANSKRDYKVSVKKIKENKDIWKVITHEKVPSGRV